MCHFSQELSFKHNCCLLTGGSLMQEIEKTLSFFFNTNKKLILLQNINIKQ